jgi:hypothetical protein
LRTGNAVLCDTPTWPGCQLIAAHAFVCNVEGREATLCRSCDKMWKEFAKGDPRLSARCPNCSKQLPEATLPRDEGMHDLLGSYYEHAMTEAMRRAGVLEPTRKAVIKLLDTDLSIWADAEKASPVAKAWADADASG